MMLLSQDRPTVVGFLLVPGFALLTYSAALEPLRAANALSGKTLYRWMHFTPDGEAALASSGIQFEPDGALERRVDKLDILLVCAGGNPANFQDKRILNQLRAMSRDGVTIGGISGGPFILARAGLLDGHRCTIHWEHAAAFEETFPKAIFTRSLFEIDRSRMTCAGAVAALDMMSAFIVQEHGIALGAAVSDWFLHDQMRSGHSPQRMDIQFRTGVNDQRVLLALRAMEANIEEPLSRRDLAFQAGLSIRQLERLFAEKVRSGMHEYYVGIRLAKARQLLRESTMSIQMVAMATGFPSQSNFSYLFKRQFGMTPKASRISQ